MRYVGIVKCSASAPCTDWHLTLFEFEAWTKHHFQVAGTEVDTYSDITEFTCGARSSSHRNPLDRPFLVLSSDDILLPPDDTDGVWQKMTIPLGMTPFYLGGVFSHLARREAPKTAASLDSRPFVPSKQPLTPYSRAPG